MTIPPVAIVTGAGSGIGRSVCELLAVEHCRLALVGRDEGKLEETMNVIAADVASPPDMLVLPADVSDREQCAGVVDMTLARWGRVDILINNAGMAPKVAVDEFGPDLLYQLFAVNVFGPLHLAQRCWDSFVKHKRGVVVNVSSRAAFTPFPGLGVYGMSKSAIDGLTRAIQNEGEGHGISAYSVAPGAVETPMLRGIFSKKDIPADQTLDPEEVAQVIVDCALGNRPGDAGGVVQIFNE